MEELAPRGTGQPRFAWRVRNGQEAGNAAHRGKKLPSGHQQGADPLEGSRQVGQEPQAAAAEGRAEAARRTRASRRPWFGTPAWPGSPSRPVACRWRTSRGRDRSPPPFNAGPHDEPPWRRARDARGRRCRGRPWRCSRVAAPPRTGATTPPSREQLSLSSRGASAPAAHAEPAQGRWCQEFVSKHVSGLAQSLAADFRPTARSVASRTQVQLPEWVVMPLQEAFCGET